MNDYFEHASMWSAVATVLWKDYHFDYAAALRVTVECHLALKCKASVDDPMTLSLPPIIDQAWHFAILNTALYRQYCERALGGKFLDHSTVTADDDVAVKNERVAATILKYIDLFHRKPPVDLWQLETEINANGKRVREGPTVTKQMVLDEPVVLKRATIIKQEINVPGIVSVIDDDDEPIAVEKNKKNKKKRPRETAHVIETKKSSDEHDKYAFDVPVIVGETPETKKDNQITVFVKSINGKTVTVHRIDPDDWTIGNIKWFVECQTDIPSEGSRLIFAGRNLDDDKTLSHYNIRDHSTFHIVYSIRAC